MKIERNWGGDMVFLPPLEKRRAGRARAGRRPSLKFEYSANPREHG